MAVTLPATGSGTATPVVATDTIAAEEYQLIKAGLGAAGAFTLLTGNTGVVGAGTLRVTLATDVALPAGTNAIGKLSANSGVDIGDVDVTSVPAPLSTTGGGTEATALRVTVASDSTGVLSVDDNGGSLTVDNAALTTADLDTGAGTDTRGVIGIVGSRSGGAQLIPGDATAGLKVDLGADNDVVISDGGNVISVDWNGTAPPIGAGTEAAALRVTVATDSTGVLSIDDNGGALTVDNSGTFAVQESGSALTALQLIDDIVYTDDTSTHATGTSKGALIMAAATPTDGSVNANDIGAVGMTTDRKLHVAVMDALPAGTNAIGKLAANSGVDIGDVDVTSLPALATGDNAVGRVKITDGTDVADVLALTSSNPLTVAVVDGNGDQLTSFGGGTQYTEDAAAAADPVGTVPILVRKDTPATITSTDGDNIAQRGTNYGAAYVQIVSSAGAFIDTFGGSGGTAEIDDADFTQATTLGTPAMGVYESTPTNVTDGDLGIAGITIDRRLKTSATVDAALPAGTNAIGKLAANSGVDIGDVDILSIAAGDNNIGNVDIVTVPAPLSTTGGGTEATALRVTVANDSTGVLSVDDNGGALTVDNAGTFAVQESGSALTALQLIDDGVYTDDTSTHSTGSSKGYGIMAAATPTDGSVNANDIGMLAMTTDRKLHTAVMDALPAGTNAIGKLAANSGVDIGDVDVTSIIPGTGTTNLGKAEDAAHSSSDTGVMSLGVRADTPNATVAANGDYHYLATDLVGGIRTALYETDFAVLGTNHVKKYYTSAGAVTDGIVWSPAAGKRWYVTDLIVNVSAAATVTFEDDKAGGDEAVAKFEFAANSGIAHHFGTPWFSGEDAADLIVTTSAGNIYITVTGYEI